VHACMIECVSEVETERGVKETKDRATHCDEESAAVRMRGNSAEDEIQTVTQKCETSVRLYGNSVKDFVEYKRNSKNSA
jgi:hypothetical protein